MDNLSPVLNGEGGLRLRQPSDDEFFAEFRGYLVGVLGRSPATAKGYTGMGRRAAKIMGKPVLKIDSDDLIAVITQKDWKPATKRSLVVAWHSIDKFARMRGYGGRNGISDLQTPSVPRNKKPPISMPNAYRLLAHVETSIQTRVAYLGLYAGLRIEESTNVTDATWLPDRLVIMGKGQKKRSVPVHPELAKARDLILARPPSSKTSAGVIFGRLRDRLDLRDVEGEPATPHSLRRTFATTLYAEGVPWERVQKLLGHDLGVTDDYVQMAFEALDEDVQKVEYRSGEPVQLSLDI